MVSQQSLPRVGVNESGQSRYGCETTNQQKNLNIDKKSKKNELKKKEKKYTRMI